ncbi:MAG: hypothetical protein JO165_11875 [Candidatus Eremiobacteraeota bacterium]|nr:hypothetical protein [Candidatus Eremiobacteraeota bacterium]
MELLNTVATVGTFLVIAATAVAAVLQLRHMRASNQFEAIQYAVESFKDPAMQRAIHYVLTEFNDRVADPEFRSGIVESELDVERHPERMVCNFQELMGSYVRHRLIPFEIYMDAAPVLPHAIWGTLEPYIAIRRRLSTHPLALYEHFEWLAAKSKAYSETHKRGVLDGKFQRLPVRDRWHEEA